MEPLGRLAVITATNVSQMPHLSGMDAPLSGFGVMIKESSACESTRLGLTTKRKMLFSIDRNSGPEYEGYRPVIFPETSGLNCKAWEPGLVLGMGA